MKYLLRNKWVVVAGVGVLLLLYVWRQSNNSAVAFDDITGAYVRFAEGDLSKVWDTLIIGVFDPQGGTYVVQQRSGFQKIRDGKLQPKEYTKEKAVVVYDASTRQLQDIKTGLLYSFPGAGKLIAGHAEYVKIN